MEAGGTPEIVLREAEQVKLLALARRGDEHMDDPNHLGSGWQEIAHHVLS
jgi:hypothetical protein